VKSTRGLLQGYARDRGGFTMGSNGLRFSHSVNLLDRAIAAMPRTTLGEREIDRKRRCGPQARDALVGRSHDQRTHARPCNHWCCKFLNTSAIADIEKECSSLFIVNVARAPARRALFFTIRQDHSVELPFCSVNFLYAGSLILRRAACRMDRA
jgi:hypothetical protein